jgi:alpha-tubulin suppressor-like RCC1 family protein
VGSDRDWADVAISTDHACAVKRGGALWCWGSNGKAQLGDGSLVDRLTPVPIGIDTDWATVVARIEGTCALKTTGSIWCWGDNGYGAVGDGSAWRLTPALVQ